MELGRWKEANRKIALANESRAMKLGEVTQSIPSTVDGIGVHGSVQRSSVAEGERWLSLQ